MIWALILRNPVAAGLSALLVTLGVYTTILKVDNLRLTSRNGTLEQAEKRRVELAASALRDNKTKEAADKKRSKQIEVEYARSKKTIDALTADNRRLLADIIRLRHGSGGDSLPQDPANPAISAATGSAPSFGESERLLIELAQRFDALREQMLACQAYVRGL